MHPARRPTNHPRDLPEADPAACPHCLPLQDASLLEPGAFYGDRAPRAKHVSWGGSATHYSEAQVRSGGWGHGAGLEKDFSSGFEGETISSNVKLKIHSFLAGIQVLSTDRRR